ncbi:MAG: hypothetical protein II109_00310, partial [Paludibacteraceae bacterium]|nr:hypothetical protein [Paludibacteraceae bacterium]
ENYTLNVALAYSYFTHILRMFVKLLTLGKALLKDCFASKYSIPPQTQASLIFRQNQIFCKSKFYFDLLSLISNFAPSKYQLYVKASPFRAIWLRSA